MAASLAMSNLKQWFSFSGFRKDPNLHDSSAATRPSVQLLAILQEKQDGEQLEHIAQELGWKLTVVRTVAEAVLSLEREPARVAICDRDLPAQDWRTMITRVAALMPSGCVLLASSVMDEYLWNEVIQCRGYDVLSKPFQREELLRVVNFAARDATRP